MMDYNCNICNKTFRYLISLQLHKLTHPKENPFKCQFCNEEFTHLLPLIHHIKNII